MTYRVVTRNAVFAVRVDAVGRVTRDGTAPIAKDYIGQQWDDVATDLRRRYGAT